MRSSHLQWGIRSFGLDFMFFRLDSAHDCFIFSVKVSLRFLLYIVVNYLLTFELCHCFVLWTDFICV